MKSKNTVYLPRLDHLRFFAALLVIVFHFRATMLIGSTTYNPLTLLVKEGETGVSLFMILSGFILTRISFGKEIDYRSYLRNRLLRIYPLYLTMVFIAAFSGGRHIDPMSFIALVSPVGNLGNVVLPKFPHIWTIAVEFQFYLVFPFLLGFFEKYGTRYLIGLIVFATLVRGMMFLTDGSIQDGAYWTILGRIDQFSIGMILAVAYGRTTRLFNSPIVLAVSIAAILGWLCALAWWTGGYYGTNASTSFAWIVTPTIEGVAWALVILAYLKQDWEWPKPIDTAFRHMGEISFSLYMWHYPVVAIFYKLYPAWNSSAFWYLYLLVPVLPTVLVVSVLSYFIIEKPFFSMKSRYVVDRAPLTVNSIPIKTRTASSVDLTQ